RESAKRAVAGVEDLVHANIRLVLRVAKARCVGEIVDQRRPGARPVRQRPQAHGLGGDWIYTIQRDAVAREWVTTEAAANARRRANRVRVKYLNRLVGGIARFRKIPLALERLRHSGEDRAALPLAESVVVEEEKRPVATVIARRPHGPPDG